MKFKDRQYTINPKATDLHVGTIARALSDRENGYIPVDNWNQVAKQLCFIVVDCDFAKYDVTTQDGELYLSATELVELLTLLRDAVDKPAKTPEQVAELVQQMSELQEQLNALQ